MIDEEAPKIYGLDSIDKDLLSTWSKDPLTAFLSTIVGCVAVTVMWVVLRKQSYFVYDNEPRNKVLIKLENYRKGDRLVIWLE